MVSRIKKSQPGILKSERHLLETGHPYPPKGSWKDQGLPWVRPFILASPAGRDELRALWLAYRDEILSGWKGKKKPWAATEFD
jgi:hypothetical protein